MTFTIAVAGKGGTGKTSISSLVIRHIKKRKLGAILAVDADPNANLADSLGMHVHQTMGALIASFNEEKIKIPAGMTKERYLEYKLNEAMTEGEGLDLVTMGRGEGADCYCYPNTVLRKFLDTVAENYAFVVMDNEAGMEHMSRRTTQNVDALLVISDHSIKGVRTVARIKDLVKELGLVVRSQHVIVNMVPGALDPAISEELGRLGVSGVLTVPRDDHVYQADLQRQSLFDLTDTCPAVMAVDGMMERVLGRK